MDPSSSPVPSGAPGERAPKPIHAFALQAGFLLALLALLPSVASLYPLLVVAEGNALFAGADSGRTVRFEWISRERADGADVQMAGYIGHENRHRWRAAYSTRRRGYWPTAALVAFLVATPMSLGRRLWVLPAGFLLQNAVLGVQIAAIAWLAFLATEPASQGDRVLRALDTAKATFTSPLPGYTAAFVIWALLGRPDRSIDLGPVRRLFRR